MCIKLAKFRDNAVHYLGINYHDSQKLEMKVANFLSLHTQTAQK